jgi:hypothetical protein
VLGYINAPGATVLHATFYVPGKGTGQKDWTGTSNIPHKFTEIKIEHQRNGQENIITEVHAHSRWYPSQGSNQPNRVDRHHPHCHGSHFVKIETTSGVISLSDGDGPPNLFTIERIFRPDPFACASMNGI